MTRPLLVIGDRRDPLAAAFERCGRRELVYTRPRAFSASFRVDPDGSVRDGVFVVGGRHLAWEDLAGVLVRPGRAWCMPSRFATVAAGLRFHEQRTAWCAVLDAFAGVVLDRLPPAWFLDPVLHGLSLARSLDAALGNPAEFGPGVEEPASSAAVTLVGHDVIADEPKGEASVALRHWLLDRLAPLSDWQRSAGVRLARLGASQRGRAWTIESVNPVPDLLSLSPAVLDARSHALLDLLP